MFAVALMKDESFMSESELVKEQERLLKELRYQQGENLKSLEYASYIQQALFPEKTYLNKVIPEHFIFFKPRDFVSGDFYWVNKRDNKVFIAVADCTGHGVPGAFVSILGIALLNLIVNTNRAKTASGTLNLLREHIMAALNQKGKHGEQKDGLDMSFAIIDTEQDTVNFSGAFNPLYIVRGKNLIQLEGDKMPIGVGADIEEAFTNHTYKLEPDDMIYLFSDGFVDQFGGENNKKYKYRPFRNLLTNIAPLPVNEQKETLNKEFYQWKGEFPQLDDVLIFGVRYQ